MGVLPYNRYMTIKNISSFFCVPYLPILGAVHPQNINDIILNELKKSSRNCKILPYDKNSRWSNRVTEQIIYYDLPIIVTKPIDDNKKTIYIYSNNPEKHLIPTDINRIFFIHKDKWSNINLQQNEIFLFEIKNHHNKSFDNDVMVLSELEPSIQKTLPNLDNDDDIEGFGFLSEQIRKRNDLGEVLVVISNNQIVGAIGPTDIIIDSGGRRQLLAPYFGVSKEYRRGGIGKKLWNNYLSHGKKLGAEYIILMSENNCPSQLFYKKMKMSSLGFVSKEYKHSRDKK